MATDWITVEANLNPVLDKINPILAPVGSVLDIMITTLNVVQAIMTVLKAFMVGLIDPLQPLVEAIVSELQSVIRDLRQIGIYLTHDGVLLRSEDKFSSIVGGYSAYERRMLARLLDTSDPSRPTFTPSTTVVGAFFYVSSEDVNDLIRTVNALLKFFGLPDLMGRANPYGTPTAPTMKYGTSGSGLGSFKQLSQSSRSAIPDSVSVTWSMPPGAGGIGTSYVPAPKGFLIQVSTIPDGFQVLSLVAKAENSSEIQNLPRVSAAAVDPITNGPLKLYGGISDIGVSADSTDFSSVEQSSDQQAPLLVLQKDQNTPLIRPSLLVGEGTTPLVANTYFVKTGAVARMSAGTKFTASFKRSDLPMDATFRSGLDGFAELDGTSIPSVYYFRIRAITTDYVDTLGIPEARMSAPVSIFGNTDSRIYRFSRNNLLTAVNGVLVPNNPGLDGDTSTQPSSITAASSPATAAFPSSTQASYIRAVQAAVAVAILCRADLTEGDLTVAAGIPIGTFKANTFSSGQGLKGLEGAGRDLLARYGIEPVWFKGTRPQQFRLRMRWAMARVASDLQAKSPPPESVAQLINTQAQSLLDFSWAHINSAFPDLTILESIGVDTADGSDSESEGVGGNPFCRLVPKDVLEIQYLGGAGPLRTPSFDFKGVDPNVWVPGEGSADFSPIIYQDGTNQRVEYVRNALLNHQDGAVLDAATSVLQIAAAPLSRPIGDTQWITVRLMPQALVPVDEILARLDRFLDGVLDGVQGEIDKIEAYIDSLQARIYQLQALLNQIDALLDSLTFFQIPSVSGLVLVESGTDGVVQGLVSSGNKPSDSASSYGAGVAVVSGGTPTALLETLVLLLGRS